MNHAPKDNVGLVMAAIVVMGPGILERSRLFPPLKFLEQAR
jgi:hypothetical protein